MKSISIASINFLILLSIGVDCQRLLSPYEYIQYKSKLNPYMRREDITNESNVRQSGDYNNDNYVNISTGALDLSNSQITSNYSTENMEVLSIESRLEPNISNIVTNDTKSALITIFHHFVNRYRADDNRTKEANDSIKVIAETDENPIIEEEYSTDFYVSTPFYDFDSYQSSR